MSRNYNFAYHRMRLHEPSEMYDDYNIYTPHAAQKFMLGTILDFDDGRRFRYSKAGAANLSIALMNQQPAKTAHWFEQVQTAMAPPSIGDKEVQVLIGATDPTLDEWADGWLLVNKGTGMGQLLKIKSNPAENDPTIVLAEPVKTAWAATSEISIIVNPNQGIIVVPQGGITGAVRGVNLTAVTALYYFWAQTKGPAPLIVDTSETVVIGEPVGRPGTHDVDGTCGLVANDGTDAVWGTVLHVGAAAEPAIIDLSLE